MFIKIKYRLLILWWLIYYWLFCFWRTSYYICLNITDALCTNKLLSGSSDLLIWLNRIALLDSFLLNSWSFHRFIKNGRRCIQKRLGVARSLAWSPCKFARKSNTDTLRSFFKRIYLSLWFFYSMKLVRFQIKGSRLLSFLKNLVWSISINGVSLSHSKDLLALFLDMLYSWVISCATTHHIRALEHNYWNYKRLTSKLWL